MDGHRVAVDVGVAAGVGVGLPMRNEPGWIRSSSRSTPWPRSSVNWEAIASSTPGGTAGSSGGGADGVPVKTTLLKSGDQAESESHPIPRKAGKQLRRTFAVEVEEE